MSDPAARIPTQTYAQAKEAAQRRALQTERLDRVFTTPTSDGGTGNVADGLFAIAAAITDLAQAARERRE